MEGNVIKLKTNKNMLAYSRLKDDAQVVVLHNLTDKPQNMPLNELPCNELKFFYGRKPAINNDIITLDAFQSVILK